MKTVMEFDHDRDGDEHLAQFYSKALSFYLAVWEFDQWMRGQLKYYGAGEETERCRAKLNECLHDKGVDLDMLP